MSTSTGLRTGIDAVLNYTEDLPRSMSCERSLCQSTWKTMCRALELVVLAGRGGPMDGASLVAAYRVTPVFRLLFQAGGLDSLAAAIWRIFLASQKRSVGSWGFRSTSSKTGLSDQLPLAWV